MARPSSTPPARLVVAHWRRCIPGRHRDGHVGVRPGRRSVRFLRLLVDSARSRRIGSRLAVAHRDHDRRGPRLGDYFALGARRRLGEERRIPVWFLRDHDRNQSREKPRTDSNGRAPARGRARLPGEDGSAGQREPRGSHADERGPRSQRATARHRSRRKAEEDDHGDSGVRRRAGRHRRRDPRLLTASKRSGRARHCAVRHASAHRRSRRAHATTRRRQGDSPRIGNAGYHEPALHRRQRPHPAGAAQLGEQRDQVHRLGFGASSRRARRPCGKGPSPPFGARYRRRHSGGFARWNFHPLPAKQQRVEPKHGRQRLGLGNQQTAGRADGWRARGEQHRRRGDLLLGRVRSGTRPGHHPARHRDRRPDPSAHTRGRAGAGSRRRSRPAAW